MTHPPLTFTTGCTHSPKILILGEAWGEHEQRTNVPFSGESGKELTRMLFEAWDGFAPELQHETAKRFYLGDSWLQPRHEWLTAAGICLTNTFNLRPAGGKIESLCFDAKSRPTGYGFVPLARGAYLDPKHLPEATRAIEEIRLLAPNLVVALGNTATWLMFQATNIGTIRGATALSRVHPRISMTLPQLKVLGTYHPAGIMRNWTWRVIGVADLMKARREGEYWELKRPVRRVIVNPSIHEVMAWTRDTIAHLPKLLAADCETERGQIKCIGFARNRMEAMIVPFIDWTQQDRSYWKLFAEEHQAWNCVEELLHCPAPKVFQNGMYDFQYITKCGIKPKYLLEDTMLLHHSLFPELQKGLGFLGSIYTDEASWKLMRKRKTDTEKRDE